MHLLPVADVDKVGGTDYGALFFMSCIRLCGSAWMNIAENPHLEPCNKPFVLRFGRGVSFFPCSCLAREIVLPDYVNRLGKEMHDMSTEEIAELERTENMAMAAFLTKDKEALDATSVPSVACRKWNRVLLKRLDGVLTTVVGFGLSSYIPKLRCSALTEGARRYVAPVVIPPHNQSVRRSCVEEADGTRRFELPRVSVNN
eukprot:4171018-Amphidinium_carterae.1